MDEPDIQFLARQPLLEGLSESELKNISKQIKIKKFYSNETIIEEGDLSSDVYIIYSGEVEILKKSDDDLEIFTITKLESGDIFGEMSYISSIPRSTFVKTTKNTLVFEISKKTLEESNMKEAIGKIISNIAKINIQRLNKSNKRLVEAYNTTYSNIYSRSRFANLSLYIIAILSLINGLYVFWTPSSNNYLNILIYWFLAFVPGLMLFFYNPQYKENFGIKFRNIKNDLLITIAIILFTSLIILGVKIYYPQLYTSTVQQPSYIWLSGYFLYCIFFEFINRGLILSSLDIVLHNPWLSALLGASITMFLPFHLNYLNVIVVGSYFVMNLVLNLIYQKNKSLLSVFLIHFFVGLTFIFSGGFVF